ncbi:MAG: prephenate dehydratase domain-containing protein [Gemmatimonadota bacterium]
MSPVVPIVAFQGESGAFSEAAAAQLVEGPITLLPCATFDDAVRAVVNGHADYAVMPVRNSIAGPVHASIDAMSLFTSIEQVRELQFPVRLALLGLPGTELDDVRQVLSHQMALLQCKRFLAEHPAIEAVEAHDTAGAARLVAIRRDRTVAAIAGAWAARLFGLVVIAEGLEDRADNATTFVLVRRKHQTGSATE